MSRVSFFFFFFFKSLAKFFWGNKVKVKELRRRGPRNTLEFYSFHVLPSEFMMSDLYFVFLNVGCRKCNFLL
jgi:hypothetical protein